MKDYINIGSVPWDEPCCQVGNEDYFTQSLLECRTFRSMIRRVLGDEPAGARLVIKTFPHDFGSYREVCCEFDEEIKEAIDYALKCEGSPKLTNWDEAAKLALKEGGYNGKLLD